MLSAENFTQRAKHLRWQGYLKLLRVKKQEIISLKQ